MFTLKGKPVGTMWHMLSDGASDLKATHRNIHADDRGDGFNSALKRAESDAKSSFDQFVSSNTVHFFGAFSPDLDRALVGMEELDAGYKKIDAIDVPGILQEWIGVDDRDFREIDVSDIPETWQSELRQSAELLNKVR